MNKHDLVYAEMVKRILDNKYHVKDNRTSTQTIGVIGHKSEYHLDAEYVGGDLHVMNFPLLTTKKVYWKGVLAELFWLINGQTNIQFLEKNGVSIWADWPLKNYNANNPEAQLDRASFCKKIVNNDDFAARWGELGPVYGKQWRAWERPFNNTIEHIDQFYNAIRMLIDTPNSRRNIVNAWNPADIEEMSKSGLPPCHTMFQLLVEKENDTEYLSLIMFQRSNERLH